MSVSLWQSYIGGVGKALGHVFAFWQGGQSENNISSLCMYLIRGNTCRRIFQIRGWRIIWIRLLFLQLYQAGS